MKCLKNKERKREGMREREEGREGRRESDRRTEPTE